MKQPNLGTLNKVDLRKAWKHEATDFTNWLAEPENLSLLSDEIGIDINLLQTERSVGNYKVDICAEEETTGRKIIIENQLESTDHDHLGKIITYASGLDAEIIIWIVKDVREEHQRAIDWLNEHTDEAINFFAIRMELWQIGDSPFAPKFYIISEPNEWAKALKQSANRELSDTKIMQLEFWNQFKEYVKNKGSKLQLRKTYPQHWYDISVGSSHAHISLTINTQENKLGVELYIPNNKELYSALEDKKDLIESDIGHELIWMDLPGKKACRIKLEKDANPEDETQWDSFQAWFKQYAESFHSTFSKKLRNLT